MASTDCAAKVCNSSIFPEFSRRLSPHHDRAHDAIRGEQRHRKPREIAGLQHDIASHRRRLRLQGLILESGPGTPPQPFGFAEYLEGVVAGWIGFGRGRAELDLRFEHS
ncbi:MAG TPA: hypothetical protein VKB89_22140, partial [Xanthobacteraceae bacterium]|nr:hypothetical protein [Xanthobacteraceae bacterium]